jgi:hypothetical protein
MIQVAEHPPNKLEALRSNSNTGKKRKKERRKEGRTYYLVI